MRYRIGSRGAPGVHGSGSGRPHGIMPGNAGISEAAQDRIDLLSSAAARKYKEAISGIDSVPLFIFQPLKSGPKCDCGADPTSDPPDNENLLGFVPDIDVSDDMKSRLKVRTTDVTAYDRHLQGTSKADPDHNFSLADIFDDTPIPPASSTKGTTDPYGADPGRSQGPYNGPMHQGRSDVALHSGSYDHEVPDSLLDTFGEELISEYDSDGWNPDSILADSAYVLGNTLSTCPICMGSGILGGYSLFGATRLVLSSANSTGGNNLGAEQNAAAVNAYNLGPGETITWNVSDFPNYFKFGWIVCRNMRKRVKLTVEYTLDGTTWKPIAGFVSDNRVNLSTLVMRVTNASLEPQDFTHLELVVFHNQVLGQVTNFNPQAGLADTVKGAGLNIVLPPDVGLIDRNSLIADRKYNLMWRVVDLNTITTAKRQVISCEASVELMQPSLVETSMYPDYSIGGPLQLIYGQGIEPILGFR